MKIYISEQRLTGPAVFLSRPFPLVFSELMRTKEFPIVEPKSIST
jgi:hypothetical protein